MTPLRQKMIDAMTVRGFSPRTHQSYLYAVTDLARHYKRSPESITLEQIQDYFVYLVKERHLSDASCQVYLHAIRFMYLQVLKLQEFNVPIPHPKRVQRIPAVVEPPGRGTIALCLRQHQAPDDADDLLRLRFASQ